MQKFDQMMMDIYRHSPLVTALLDRELLVVWANDAALKHYPTLSRPQGLLLLLPGTTRKLLDVACHEAGEQGITLLCSEHEFCFMPLENGYLLQVVQSEKSGLPLTSGMKGSAVSIIAGKTRVPLSNIFSCVSTLSRQRECQENERLIELIEQINGETYHLLRFSNCITDYLQQLDGIVDDQMESVELSGFVARTMRAAAILTEKAGIPLTFELPEHSAFVEANLEQLTKALMHVISNCCSFTREGNKIYVSLTINDNLATITVSDQGLGIPTHLLDRVFEPFFSYDHFGGPYAGSGLGLSLATGILAQHGGNIAISSVEGEGTIVAMRLPLCRGVNLTLRDSAPIADQLRDRYSALNVLLSDSCGVPKL